MRRTWSLCVVVLVLVGGHAWAQFTPPPEPEVRPSVPVVVPEDANRNGVADTLEGSVENALAALSRAATEADRLAALATLAAPVSIELVFDRQITQAQLDVYLAAGGHIDHIFRSVSYGWTGYMPLSAVGDLPALMGESLVVVMDSRPTELTMDEASQTGRVRPIWAASFAGVAAGINGDSNTTIAIIDSGLDGTHTDLAGRQVYWVDWTSDAAVSPLDYVQHGSHVAGIALGTGAAKGSGTSTLYFTDEGNLTGVPTSSFYPSPIHASWTANFSATATFNGGGTATLGWVRGLDGGGWSALIGATSGGTSPVINTVNGYAASAADHYSAYLPQNAATNITDYAVANSVTSYPGVGDGFNALSGVCPGCQWAGLKVFTNAGSGNTTDIGEALDDIVTQRKTLNIKVANMSIGVTGSPGISTTTRAKANTAVDNGIVLVCSAGNDGPGTAAANEIDDPGRAAKVITVGATNDHDELTAYTSSGFTSPGSTAGQEEDYKPDVLAPGGSSYFSKILSVDSNTADGSPSSGIADQQADDYYNIMGTSMASPFVAGAAGLIIDAMQQAGVTWDHDSSADALLVKALLSMTATETNANREAGTGTDPTLQRAAAGSGTSAGWPASKDRFEGYGIINPDAAVEAVLENWDGSSDGDSLGGSYSSRRAWARNVTLVSGVQLSVTMTPPAGGDFDLYLYSGTPGTYGNPQILASSTTAGNGAGESINYTPGSSSTAYIVVKAVSGSGAFTIAGTVPVELSSFSIE